MGPITIESYLYESSAIEARVVYSDNVYIRYIVSGRDGWTVHLGPTQKGAGMNFGDAARRAKMLMNKSKGKP